MLKKYFLRLMIFLVLLLAGDRALYALLSNAFHKTETGETGGFINKIRSIKAEALIVGDSRAMHHYDPVILQDTLKMRVYNAGVNGQGMPYIRGITDLILRDYKPGLLIFNVDARTLVASKDKRDRITILAPFMDESEVIRELIYNRSFFEPCKYLFHLFRFNSRPFAILRNLHAQDKTISGFEPLRRVLNPALIISEDNLEAGEHADAYLVGLLRATLHQAKSAGVPAVIVNSPRWRSVGRIDPGQKPLFKILEALADEEGVPYLSINQENTARFQDAALYTDPAHLNEQGAQIFTRMVAQWLQQKGYGPSGLKIFP